MTKRRPFPPAGAHGDLVEVFAGIHFVTGSMTISGPLPVRFSRNMTIVAEDGEVTLINSVRLNEAGLKAVEALGNVSNIIRIAGFHGRDDPFYKDRYGATVWSVDAPYVPGFDSKAEPYFSPDIVIDRDTGLPLKNARLALFESTATAEGLLLLERDGGIVVSGDCLQNWATTNRYFNLPARLMMRMMGFIKPHNIGPGWRKVAKPDPDEIRSILAGMEFDHVLPAHGDPVKGNARQLYAPAVAAL
ncbi:hypothetical protein [Hoeflea poritis]|uniref:MBL fold metallo-hydrolase n=1 Tax=Hoeflea poritis TaxID=2993659 RepID=A0ABT4VMZ9_9HYPH|nr:hypothetical protein [Hoeflea poritis]MDA4845550.1 hypothetical protein [Hoeflea poritis]